VGIFAENKISSGSESLCGTCTSALVLSGYRKSKQMTVCTYVHPNIVLPFKVNSCSGYYDRSRPRKQMEGFKVVADRNMPTKVTTHVKVDLDED
jgi:uncharacterized CHY-type Zn-finger protein